MATMSIATFTRKAAILTTRRKVLSNMDDPLSNSTQAKYA
jgi:hypothetical protein